jgi:hypothetical protein
VIESNKLRLLSKYCPSNNSLSLEAEGEGEGETALEAHPLTQFLPLVGGKDFGISHPLAGGKNFGIRPLG